MSGSHSARACRGWAAGLAVGQALKRLRELLGDADYYQGRLSSRVPVWRFEEIR